MNELESLRRLTEAVETAIAPDRTMLIILFFIFINFITSYKNF